MAATLEDVSSVLSRFELRIPEDPEFTVDGAVAAFRQFQTDLRQGRDVAEKATRLYDTFCATDALLLVLLDPALDSSLVNDVAKLPVLVANASLGARSLEQWDRRLVRTVLLCRQLVAEEKHPSLVRCLPQLMASMCSNLLHDQGALAQFVKDCEEYPFADSQAHLGNVLKDIPRHARIHVLRPFADFGQSSATLTCVLGQALPQSCPDTMKRLLLTRRYQPKSLSSLVRYIVSSCSSEALLSQYLKQAFDVWGDPVIARGYVRDEVMHLTKIVLLFVLYADRRHLMACQSVIAENLASGLPNHFNSTDGRTVLLGKFFSSLLMQTLRHYSEGTTKLPEELQAPEDPICFELIEFMNACEYANEFWFLPELQRQTQLGTRGTETAPADNVSAGEAPESDDDDSDLEPIESNDAPPKEAVKYLLHFLEKFPEMKTFDDVRGAMAAIPTLVSQQLQLDHPQVGMDLIKMLFYWENEFEDAQLDDLRKTSLITILEVKPQGNLEYLCRLFHQDYVQPYRKNLIFDVLGRVAKNAKLKDLQFLTTTAFRMLLVSPNIINRQDVIVRIPMILFFSRLLCLLPQVMVTGDMVAQFMNSLSSLTEVDCATEQTVSYALANVMESIGDMKFDFEEQKSVRSACDWLSAVRAELS